ncbi:transcriptional regulator [Clostridium sp. P21]|uniref:Transcriptional regulator n=1 Tax=Clostridium muellerianum TaxID=2716538 RepID=A0A7Y0EEI6_9CLOT|nr:helix-turn-helix transcriptional regulator [Clostridium muellerianum]NMM61918.1 transcriptional regulator [Clostridium muellerianum]
MDLKMDFLTRLAKALAKQFGDNCEIVIHDLNKASLDSSIVAIENGHVSDRNVGDGPSMVVLDTLTKKPEEIEDQLCYLTEVDGKMIKSSTIYIRDENGEINGIFGINYDISPMVAFQKEVKSLISVEPLENDESTHIYHDVNNLLDDLIRRAVKLIGRPVKYMTREDKIKAIQFLNEHGAFLITKSGDKISNYFGISKYTMYSYLDKELE